VFKGSLDARPLTLHRRQPVRPGDKKEKAEAGKKRENHTCFIQSVLCLKELWW
jgi:hypothetical protein